MILEGEICDVELCSKPATPTGLCVLHRKKAVHGELEYDDDGTVWDTCSNGHRWTIETTHYENNSKGGKRRRCRICLALKAQRKAEEPVVVKAPDPIRPKDERMSVAMDSFDKSQVEVKGKCHGSWDKWTDYDADNIPSRQAARLMCEGCPLLQACANNAAVIEPAWGVWGPGEVWVYGRKYDSSMKALLHDED